MFNPTVSKILVMATAAVVLLLSTTARAGVTVFDQVTKIGHPVQLAVITKGRFLVKGGQRVTLHLGETRLKRILTGGDGLGYLTYTPSEVGLHRISADYQSQRGTGWLLVTAPQEQVILIDVETVLRKSGLAIEPRGGSRSTLEALDRRFQIIYLHGLAGLTLTRRWLRTNELPASVVLPWRKGGTLKMLARRGIEPFAIIGSAEQLTESAKTIQRRFSFAKTKDGRQIDDWQELFKALELDTPATPE